jgi:hypothetical protein
VLLLKLVTLAAAVLAGCQHGGPAPTAAQRDTRRLLVLEEPFHSFVSTPLATLEDVEVATARLEGLRLRYLDAVSLEQHSDGQLWALVRIGELHLDLSARVRRLPYPAGLSPDEQRRFDNRLSQRALPLEAVGTGVLEQVVARAAREGNDERAARRARLYLRLHGGQPLAPDDIALLQSELVAPTFRAPRSLLEAGRIGQRAARR